MITKTYENFEKYFNIKKENASKLIDFISSAITHKPQINIIKFDDWLCQEGYDIKKHGSMKDYVLSNYGKTAMKFIEDLI